MVNINKILLLPLMSVGFIGSGNSMHPDMSASSSDISVQVTSDRQEKLQILKKLGELVVDRIQDRKNPFTSWFNPYQKYTDNPNNVIGKTINFLVSLSELHNEFQLEEGLPSYTRHDKLADITLIALVALSDKCFLKGNLEAIKNQASFSCILLKSIKKNGLDTRENYKALLGALRKSKNMMSYGDQMEVYDKVNQLLSKSKFEINEVFGSKSDREKWAAEYLEGEEEPEGEPGF